MFVLQLYLQNPGEAEGFLREFFKKLFPALEQMSRSPGKQPSEINFNPPNNNLDSAVAMGALVHEYYHYLQYTTRAVGLLFYECRYQQFLITQTCVNRLSTLQERLELPLIKAHDKANQKTRGVFDDWWNVWGPYQAAISASGLGIALDEEEHFATYVRSGLSKKWNPTIEVKTEDGQSYNREVSIDLLLETEADIVTMEVLQALFPDRWTDACDVLAGNLGPESCSLAIPFLYAGLADLIPLLMDYSMQSPMHSESGCLRSPAELFVSMFRIAKDRYSGMQRHDILKHRKEIEETIGAELGIRCPSKALSLYSEAVKNTGISKTAIGRMLLRCTKFRLDHPDYFAVPFAFIFIILVTMPSAIWVNYNLGILDIEQSRRGIRYGFLPKGREEFDAELLRLLLWGAHEIAIRNEGFICPECHIKSRWPRCSGKCGFIEVCKHNFGIDLFKQEWITT